jgi:hypothetical protein
MQYISSLLSSNPTKKVRAVTTLLNSMCIVVPVLTAIISVYDIFLYILKDGAKMEYCNA